MDARVLAALGCLTIGVADWIYLNGHVMPSVVRADTGSRSAGAEPVAASPAATSPAATSPASISQATEPDVPAIEQSEADFGATVHFDIGSAELDTAARAEIDRVTVKLRDDPSLLVRIEGHADLRGESSDNELLGQRRADVVADHMVEGGIAFERLTVVSLGESRPRAMGDDDESHRQNRRVELTVARPSHSFQGGRR